jgi:CHAT domain-containing protein
VHANQVILPRQHATLAAVVEHLPDTTHFHVSSHGRHDPVHAARSGVQRVGGVLRLEMLQDITLLAAPVVVLSACETGLADIVRLPEEFIGLPTGFIQAGAAAIVASLWPVRDEAALNVISHFYQACLDESGRGMHPWLRP